MSTEQDDNDKSHEPTQQKLKKARQKGDVVRSQDVTVAASYAGLLLAFATTGTATVESIGTVFQSFLDQPEGWRQVVFAGAPGAPIGGLMTRVSAAIAPWFIIPASLVLILLILQRGIVFAPDKIKPKLNRLSILSNAKKKFGRSGLFEFSKSAIKLLIYSLALFLFLRAHLDQIAISLLTNPSLSMLMLATLCTRLLLVVLLVSTGLGALDYLWQRHEHIRKNRMSHKEMRDEHKENEGDPHLKQARRQRAQAVANNHMLADVPDADVLIVNPTHFAVALKWSRAAGTAPVCVAKGTDEIAARIRQIAHENGVPVHSDPPTARALFATTEIGHEIAPDHYKAVAAAIRFSDAMRTRAKG